MILKVEQTNANLKNQFIIKENDRVKFLAGTPWLDINMPLNIDRKRSCILTTPEEDIIYITDYSIKENVSNNIIPLKWVFTGKQKSKIFNIIDKNNNVCSKFYKLTNGLLDTKYVIDYNDYGLICYDKSTGKTRNISIYLEDKQIAQIVKPLNRTNNLDSYYIFILDNYQNLAPTIAFFAIFFDYLEYTDSEITTHKEEVSVAYTYDKNDKYYNKDWLKNNFNNVELEKIYNEMQIQRESTKNNIKKQAKIILLFVGLSWLILIGITIIVLLLNK